MPAFGFQHPAFAFFDHAAQFLLVGFVLLTDMFQRLFVFHRRLFLVFEHLLAELYQIFHIHALKAGNVVNSEIARVV